MMSAAYRVIHPPGVLATPLVPRRAAPAEAFHYPPCPHCGLLVQIAANKINCRIFRHGALIGTMTQISPHAPKATCDALAASGSIYGCGKPFHYDGKVATACGYV